MRHNIRTNPLAIFTDFWRYRALIWQMAKREVLGRYRGSMMGLLWSFFNPIFMLAIYTFFFGVVMKTRWDIANSSKADFAIILFSGLIVYNLFAECMNRAPMLIVSQVNYVKKVVFPLQILPWTSTLAAIFHSLISLFVLLLFIILVKGNVHETAIWLPLIDAPFIFLILGIGWFLSALGVFLRDIAQTMTVITSLFLFLSPVFYPITALPEQYRYLLYFNPLTFIIEQNRAMLLWGQSPDWQGWVMYSLVCLLVAWLGLWWFQRIRKEFADVM